MIVPITTELAWESLLRSIPVWEPPVLDILLMSPHPDDETLGAGGLIAQQVIKGASVRVVAVTDGERAYQDYPSLAPIRRAEQEEALKKLGLSPQNIVRLGLPDSALHLHEEELLTRMLPLVSEGTMLVAPWSDDYHPDHEVCGRVAEKVAELKGAYLASYLFWTWHRGTLEDLTGSTLRRLPLNENLLAAKSEALQCHRSQLKHPSGEPILPEDLLSPAKRPYEVFLVP